MGRKVHITVNDIKGCKWWLSIVRFLTKKLQIIMYELKGKKQLSCMS